MPLTFNPHAYKPGKDGTVEVDPINSSPYILLQSHTQGTLYYVPKDNKYYAAPGKEVPQERFESFYLPYLHWKYDVVENGVNTFPPSPENILKKRQELMAEAMSEGKLLDQETLLNETSPTEMTNNAMFESKLGKTSVDEKLIARLKH